MSVSVNLDAILTAIVIGGGGAIGGGGFWLGVVSHKVSTLINWRRDMEKADREDRAGETELRVAISELRGEMKGYMNALTNIVSGARADLIAAAARADPAPPYEPRPQRRRSP